LRGAAYDATAAVQISICGVYERSGIGAVSRISGRTPRERRGIGGRDSAHERSRHVHRGEREEYHELVSTKAEDQVLVAQSVVEGADHGDQSSVSGRVPGRVVDSLQTVQVDHDHGDVVALARSGGQGGMDRLVEGASVPDSGERIGARNALQARDELLARGCRDFVEGTVHLERVLDTRRCQCPSQLREALDHLRHRPVRLPPESPGDLEVLGVRSAEVVKHCLDHSTRLGLG